MIPVGIITTKSLPTAEGLWTKKQNQIITALVQKRMLKLYPSQGIFATIDTDRIIEIENVIFHSAHCMHLFCVRTVSPSWLYDINLLRVSLAFSRNDSYRNHWDKNLHQHAKG